MTESSVLLIPVLTICLNEHHMRIIISALLITILASCNRSKDKVDYEVNQKIINTFSSQGPELWNRVEKEFYLRISELGILNEDSLEAFYDLMLLVQEEGYPAEYYVNHESPNTISLIQQLERIGYSKNDESAHRFLYQITKPIVQLHNYSSDNDMIYWYSVYNPDSIPISFDLSASRMPTEFDRPNLNREGLYKVTLLFYFSRMIEGPPRSLPNYKNE